MPSRHASIAPRLRSSRSRSAAIGWRPVRLCALFLLSGIVPSACLTVAAIAQTDATWQSTRTDPFAVHIAEASKRFGVPVAWIRAIMRQESAGDVHAISAAGARGLMQIMPDTWTEQRDRWSLGQDPFDPRDNIFAGAAYLREMHDRFGSPGFLAAYNAGPARYEAYLVGHALPAETRAYMDALSPLVADGSVTEPAAVFAAPTIAASLPWRGAPLFVRLPMPVATVQPTRSVGETSAAAGNSLAPVVSTIAPRSDGLFVPRTAFGGPR